MISCFEVRPSYRTAHGSGKSMSLEESVFVVLVFAFFGMARLVVTGVVETVPTCCDALMDLRYCNGRLRNAMHVQTC